MRGDRVSATISPAHLGAFITASLFFLTRMDTKDKGTSPQGLSWTQPATLLAPSGTKAPQVGTPSFARNAGIFAAGIVVGVLVSWGYSATTNRTTVADDNGAATAQSSQGAGLSVAADGSAQSSFEVVTPQAAGKKVAIARALVSKPTWVVVYDSVGGDIGRVLGASLFNAQKQSGSVPLLRATVPGKEYFVGQTLDNGDRTFSVKNDTPVLVDGEPLLLSFTAN